MSRVPGTVRAAVSAALLVVSGALPAAAQSAPATGTLPSGVRYTVYADPAAKAGAIALWYRAPNAGFDGPPVVALSRLAAETVAASTPVTGTSLVDLVTRAGGRLTVSAFPDSVAVTVLAPPERVAALASAMSRDFFAPVVDARGLEIARRDTAEDALFRSVDPSEAIEDALGTAMFAAGPLHTGTIADAQTLRGATVERVRAYAERAFRPDNAVLVLAGNVDPHALEGLASRAGARVGSPEAPAPEARRSPAPPIHVAGNAGGIGLGWAGPPIADEAAATALDFVAAAYFGERTGIVTRALGRNEATVTGKFVTYHDPGLFLVTIAGGDTAAARAVVERVLASAAKPLDPATFAAARNAFVYGILASTTTPVDVADTVGWYSVEGAPSYAPSLEDGAYLRAARALTPAAVARAVARYLGVPPVIVTVDAKPRARTTRT